METFNTAQDAFEYLYKKIMKRGKKQNDTKAIYNCGFYITNPQNNLIFTKWRKWNNSYAEYEWKWYMSGNQNADEIAKRAPIWKNMQDEKGNVNSNYGYQWSRGNQLNNVIKELRENPTSRRAVISIYDGKENNLYYKDTPCTLAINFFILNNKLEMSVMMRSNDLVFGFCNDQYCFSELQKLIASELKMAVGGYYHFSTNMHIYERHFNLNSSTTCKNCGTPLNGRADKKACSAKCRSIYNIQEKRKLNKKI
jgi:thymidylate synthase